MKQSVAATISIVVAPIAWLLVVWGGLSFIADPAPGTSRDLMRLHFLFGHAAFFLGLIALAVSVWLAGYSWSGAKYRSAFAFLLICAPILLTLAPLFR
jgi:hypothetical protein